jgi:hypothetical protein
MLPLRYTILWHDGIAEPHFDLMFQTRPGSALATWRSLAWPIERETPLVRLKDHRRDFLEYEGELTGHRGRVRRVAGGTCELSIGQNAIWQVRSLDAAAPFALILQQIGGEHWQVRPELVTETELTSRQTASRARKKC